MKLFLDDRQHLHHGTHEFTGARLMPVYEQPQRLFNIVKALSEKGFEKPEAPDDHGLQPILDVHDTQFVNFLQGAWERWTAKCGDIDALPWNWPTRSMPSFKRPDTIEGQLAYHALDAGAPITANTWTSAYWSAQSAIAAAQYATTGASAFALCRPPGHHATRDVYGAYCFLNNAAIAAQVLKNKGCKRVAIIDVDYHHGNGTQEIFYQRADVYTVSIHGDPRTVFPYFSGYAEEVGVVAGEGTNLNIPLPNGTENEEWLKALHHAIAKVRHQNVDALVVSLGLDTAAGDPVSTFQLRGDVYLKMGEALRKLNVPTVFVLEGGYSLALVGPCAAAVIYGFCAA